MGVGAGAGVAAGVETLWGARLEVTEDAAAALEDAAGAALGYSKTIYVDDTTYHCKCNLPSIP